MRQQVRVTTNLDPKPAPRERLLALADRPTRLLSSVRSRAARARSASALSRAYASLRVHSGATRSARCRRRDLQLLLLPRERRREGREPAERPDRTDRGPPAAACQGIRCLGTLHVGGRE